MGIASDKEAEPTRVVDPIQAHLTHYSSELTYESLTSEAVRAAKVRIIDTLGVLVAGFDGEPCRIARTLATEVPYDKGATILGTPIKVPLEMAAFANGWPSISAASSAGCRAKA